MAVSSGIVVLDLYSACLGFEFEAFPLLRLGGLGGSCARCLAHALAGFTPFDEVGRGRNPFDSALGIALEGYVMPASFGAYTAKNIDSCHSSVPWKSVHYYGH